MLGNIECIPSDAEVSAFLNDRVEVRSVISSDDRELIHKMAQQFLAEQDISSAWKLLLAAASV